MKNDTIAYIYVLCAISRNLQSKENKVKLNIDNFENKPVANIAMQNSSTQLELEQLYKVGMKGLEMAKTKLGNDTDKFIRFSMWWVRQSILKYSQENFTT